MAVEVLKSFGLSVQKVLCLGETLWEQSADRLPMHVEPLELLAEAPPPVVLWVQ